MEVLLKKRTATLSFQTWVRVGLSLEGRAGNGAV
jgi:hypothetical protein